MNTPDRPDAWQLVMECAVAFIESSGPCEDVGDDEQIYCVDEHCVYCSMARAVQTLYDLGMLPNS